MKTSILLFAGLFCILYFRGQAQVLNQDAQGKSSILINGSTIGFDVTQLAANLVYNNYTFNKDKNYGLTWGAAINAKGEEGLFPVLTEGAFVPSAGIKGLLGCTWTKTKSEPEKRLYTLRIQIGSLEKTLSVTDQTFSKTVTAILQPTGTPEIVGIILEHGDQSVGEMKSLIDSLIKQNAMLKDKLDSIYSLWTERNKKIENLLSSLTQYDHEAKYWKKILAANLKPNYRFSLFLDFGLKGLQFKQMKEVDTSDFSKSFKSVLSLGGFLHLGINYQYKGTIIGGLFGYEYVDNFSTLSKQEVKITSLNHNQSQTMTSEKSITAYKGDFHQLGQYAIHLDFLQFISLKKQGNVAINLYYNQTISTNEVQLPSLSALGIGTYFFKTDGLFCGGFYIEVPDVGNKLSAFMQEGNYNAITGKLNFGILGKFSIKSMDCSPVK